MDERPRQFRFLIAEDDVNISLALKAIIKSNLPTREVVTTTDGREAWEKARYGDFDMVISDWNMPKMNGLTLLRRIRGNGRTRALPFLMITVNNDRESVTTAIKAGVTDYITKPFDKGMLIRKIERMLGIDATRREEADEQPSRPEESPLDVQRIRSRALELIEKEDLLLPSMHHVVFKLEETMQEDSCTVEEMANIIELDAAISSKMIAVANSVYYRGERACTLVREAIIRLGLKETKELVYLIANRSLYAMKDHKLEGLTERLFIHSIACGVASRSVAEHLEVDNPYRFFTLGLLHDVGKLLLLQLLSETTREQRELDLAAVREIIDSLHTELGGRLLERWRFPRAYSLVASRHHDVSGMNGSGEELTIVHFADIFVKGLGFSLTEDDGHDAPAPDRLGLDGGVLDGIAREVEGYTERVRSLI